MSQNKAWDALNITHSHIRYQSERHWGGFFFPLTQAHNTVTHTHTQAYTPTHRLSDTWTACTHTNTHWCETHILREEERQRWAVTHPYVFPGSAHTCFSISSLSARSCTAGWTECGSIEIVASYGPPKINPPFKTLVLSCVSLFIWCFLCVIRSKNMLLKQAPSQDFQGTSCALEETCHQTPQATVAVLLSSMSACKWGCIHPLIADPNKNTQDAGEFPLSA